MDGLALTEISSDEEESVLLNGHSGKLPNGCEDLKHKKMTNGACTSLLPPPPIPPSLNETNGFSHDFVLNESNLNRSHESSNFESGSLLPPPPVPPSLQIFSECYDEPMIEQKQDVSQVEFDFFQDAEENHVEEPGLARLNVLDSKFWSQSVVPTKFYTRDRNGELLGTEALKQLQTRFKEVVLDKIQSIKDTQLRCDPPSTGTFYSCCDYSHSSDGDGSDAEDRHESRRSHKYDKAKKSISLQEIERKMNHPAALHQDIAFNEPGQLNDGPNCKCSWVAKQTGIRHEKFAGEKPVPLCDKNSNNASKLYHYVLYVDPSPSWYSRNPTTVEANGFCYEFDGFSMFFHQPLPDIFPQVPINQWSTDFSLRIVKEVAPEVVFCSFTVDDLELFYTYLFDHILELYDLKRSLSINDPSSSCLFYHCMPRFIRCLPDEGKEILPMSAVLSYFSESFVPFINDKLAYNFCQSVDEFRDFAHKKKGKLYINPKKKPMAIRVDLIDSSDQSPMDNDFYPMLTHFGMRASAYAYSGKPEYQKALRYFIRLRHLISLKTTPTEKDFQMLDNADQKLMRLKAQCAVKRDLNVAFSSRGFFETGFYSDIVHHAMLMVLVVNHIRFHCSLKIFETERIEYSFKNPEHLQLALIHPSFRTNYGTNHDHAKNTLNNIGLRIGKDGKSKESKGTLQSSSRKRGINALMDIMSMQGSKKVEQSDVMHNERLEFLGDAVVEFIATIHLFFMFQELEEGGLAIYRSAIVQNNNLATLAERIGLHEFMVYAHGPDLCHEHDLRHAMANAFEALMAAVLFDGGIKECDRIFSKALFGHEPRLLEIWNNLSNHPLKKDPKGDRDLVEKVPCLKLISEFEDSIGVKFKHIRLLAKALTRRNVPYNYLTYGHNQRLEFLGDTVLQLITTEYLYKHFPHHHEGHLSLLRTCLVSNKTQSVICDDLSMTRYLVIPKSFENSNKSSSQLRLKDKADLVEAFIGALYIDQGIQHCKTFCRVCFFPRLKYFITNQRWNDPKSQLQQCCLTMRQPDSGDPDIPEYKTIGIEGSTNARMYRVAVYFKGKRLAVGNGGNIQQAQMSAADNALKECSHLFPAFIAIKNGEAAPSKEPPLKRRKLNARQRKKRFNSVARPHLSSPAQSAIHSSRWHHKNCQTS